MKRWIARTILVALALAAGAAHAAPAPKLKALESVEQLRETFNGDQGKPRLVLLLSPT